MKIISLLKGSSIESVSVNEILTFISMYPEWLSRVDILWEHIYHIRDYLYRDYKPYEPSTKLLLKQFLCDLIQVSLFNHHVFSPFIITRDSEYPRSYSKYKDEEIVIADFSRVEFNFFRILRDKELSGVKFLLNILKEVVEC